MIPKTIHYCWFGGKPLTRRARTCIASWHRLMPEAHIVEWNESNYDLNGHPYLIAAQRVSKWAFASDYVRLDTVYRHGGIYLDVDVELVRPLDDLLGGGAFCGFDQEGYVATGLILAAERGHPLIRAMRDDYDRLHDLTPCPEVQTAFLAAKGLRKDDSRQTVDGLTVYPARYFDPLNYRHGRCVLTRETYSIHHYDESWQSVWTRLLRRTRIALERRFDERLTERLVAIKRMVLRGGAEYGSS